MAQSGKASLKRGKPNYIYTVVGVALVLLIMGIMGWFFLNLNAVGNTFKEDIRLSAYMRTLNKDTITQIQQFIAAKPYAKNVVYVDKTTAKEIWNKENNEDWAKILDINPLPESIDFYAKAEYVNKDSLAVISADLMANYGNQITDLQYPQSLVTSLNERASKIGLIFLVVAITLCVIVIFSIDNTIRLAMFSNRFLIKTMQMVGATQSFIARQYPRSGQWTNQFWYCDYFIVLFNWLGRIPVSPIKRHQKYQPYFTPIWRIDYIRCGYFGIKHA